MSMDFSPYVSQLTQQHKLCTTIKQAKASVELYSKDRESNKQLQHAFRDSMGTEKNVMLAGAQGFIHYPKAVAFAEVLNAQSETLKAIEDAKRDLDRACHELATMEPNYGEIDEEVLAELQRYAIENS
mmetsp:Transcript_28557/g.50754  ORF Transcript_28557/g.50754 Transcript_28557/m.50754 type:complete len:128 (+) Transcript_28557:2479-2862(+)